MLRRTASAVINCGLPLRIASYRDRYSCFVGPGEKKVERDDVKTIYIPASEIAENAGIKGAANMVILGKLFKETSFCTPENLDKGLQKTIPAKKMDLLDKNRLCIKLGTEY